MDKICARCGFQMQEDDFLCPECGAIWGDPVYRKPAPPEPVSDVPEGEKAEETKKRLPKWFGTAVTALVLLLVFSLVVHAAVRHKNRELENNDKLSTTASTTSTSKPDYIFTMPVAPELESVTYTVTFLDPLGNPVPNVKIVDPYAMFSSSLMPEPYVSDADGTITITAHRNLNVSVRILEVPSGYFCNDNGSVLYFAEGQTDMVIDLDFAEQHTHSVTMLDPELLLAPLDSHYLAGKTLNVKVDYDPYVGFMLFCNGVEVKKYRIYDTEYWVFSLVMPEEDIELDLKVYDIKDLPVAHELLIKAYYRQYPSTEYVSVKHHYGEFASGAAAVIFDTNSTDYMCGYVVAGYQFFFPNTDTIRVQKDEQFHSLKNAYELGYLTNEDIALIYSQHTELFPELYYYTVPEE